MPCSIELKRKAKKFLDKLDKELPRMAERIRERLNELAENPDCEARLKGRLANLCRARAGSHQDNIQARAVHANHCNRAQGKRVRRAQPLAPKGVVAFQGLPAKGGTRRPRSRREPGIPVGARLIRSTPHVLLLGGVPRRLGQPVG